MRYRSGPRAPARPRAHVPGISTVEGCAGRGIVNACGLRADQKLIVFDFAVVVERLIIVLFRDEDPET